MCYILQHPKKRDVEVDGVRNDHMIIFIITTLGTFGDFLCDFGLEYRGSVPRNGFLRLHHWLCQE